MSEDNEYDWGTKKMKYYQMNKRINNKLFYLLIFLFI